MGKGMHSLIKKMNFIKWTWNKFYKMNLNDFFVEGNIPWAREIQMWTKHCRSLRSLEDRHGGRREHQGTPIRTHLYCSFSLHPKEKALHISFWHSCVREHVCCSRVEGRMTSLLFCAPKFSELSKVIRKIAFIFSLPLPHSKSRVDLLVILPLMRIVTWVCKCLVCSVLRKFLYFKSNAKECVHIFSRSRPPEIACLLAI